LTFLQNKKAKPLMPIHNNWLPQLKTFKAVIIYLRVAGAIKQTDPCRRMRSVKQREWIDGNLVFEEFKMQMDARCTAGASHISDARSGFDSLAGFHANAR